MSKQWGHGFYSGRADVINGLLRSTRAKSGEIPVFMRQIGGKYCSFRCPVCRRDSGFFKMTSASGWCEECGSSFLNFESRHEITAKHSPYPDMVGVFQMDAVA